MKLFLENIFLNIVASPIVITKNKAKCLIKDPKNYVSML